MRKRRSYKTSLEGSTGHASDRLLAMASYQTQSAETCLSNINALLDNKTTCQKFVREAALRPTVHNMVSTIHVNSKSRRINLNLIAESMTNTTYDRKRFAAITIRLANPKTTVLLFSSGKLVITGSVSRQMAMAAVRSVMHMLRILFVPEEMSYTVHTIQNIVCNVRLPNLSSIDIDKLYTEKSMFCTFQPGIFPGLIFRPIKSPVVLLIFRSSRIVVTGARTYTDILDGFSDLIPQIKPFFEEIVPSLVNES